MFIIKLVALIISNILQIRQNNKINCLTAYYDCVVELRHYIVSAWKMLTTLILTPLPGIVLFEGFGGLLMIAV